MVVMDGYCTRFCLQNSYSFIQQFSGADNRTKINPRAGDYIFILLCWHWDFVIVMHGTNVVNWEWMHPLLFFRKNYNHQSLVLASHGRRGRRYKLTADLLSWYQPLFGGNELPEHAINPGTKPLSTREMEGKIRRLHVIEKSSESVTSLGSPQS